jgi:membrane fusion protein (multidrug efflux system)
MAERTLKVVSETAEKLEGGKAKGRFSRGRLRFTLLIVLPLIAAAVGSALYLNGGRYISTDNAYIGAQKVLITPDISGKIMKVLVREGQHVAAGEPLFEIDAEPFRLALAQAQAKLASVRTDFANLKSNLQSLTAVTELGRKGVEIKEHEVERKMTLLQNRSGTQADVETATAGALTAKLQNQLAEQQRASTLNQLLGNPDLPIEEFPPYRQAQAAVEQAQRDLAHTVLRAPIGGTATQVDNIQLGRFVMAGTPVFSILDDRVPWIDANPKETDITYLRVGQPVTIEVDAFPDHVFHGTVAAVSPGTGAQFSILPPQNASGNWVKVVQRVPVRIALDQDDANKFLRSGISANVEIDTGHSRSLASIFGAAKAAQP